VGEEAESGETVSCGAHLAGPTCPTAVRRKRREGMEAGERETGRERASRWDKLVLE
jgi:hypothetical protein